MPDLEGLDSPPRVIAVYIAGAWSADDFSQLLRNLEDTYNLSAVLAAGLLGEGHVREQFFPLDRRKVRHLAGQRIEAPLAVIRLQYASPGSVDLVGLGTLAGHVKEFLLGLLDRYQNRRFRQLDLQAKVELAERTRFETAFERDQRLAAARREEQLHGLEIQARELDLQRREEENRSLRLQNLERETEFTARSVRLCRESGLSIDQAARVAQWIHSRERPLVELIELKQILDVQDRGEDTFR